MLDDIEESLTIVLFQYFIVVGKFVLKLVVDRLQEQQTPLHIASRLGNVDIVMLLLQHGADLDAITKDMYTPLHIAAKEGQDEVAAVLLEHGANNTAATKRGFTPLHLAAKYGNIKVAKLLIQKDAPVDAQGKV